MIFRNKRINKLRITLSSLISASCLIVCSHVWAQTAGGSQAIIQDESEMMRMNDAQMRQVQSQERQAEAKAVQDEQKDAPYRAYAEKRIQELEKLKGSPASAAKQIEVLQNWLKADAQLRTQDQQTIRSLQRQLANMQQSQREIMANIGNDINSMRQRYQDQRDDVKFNQMMQVNQFNELQSEMGACSWGRPPTDGTFNSVGGYGFLGGYGYSGGFGRGGVGGRGYGW